jgi:predicted nucleic-acid-binding Zn-ribbon protein
MFKKIERKECPKCGCDKFFIFTVFASEDNDKLDYMSCSRCGWDNR